jgi:RHS repeat-associated protein
VLAAEDESGMPTQRYLENAGASLWTGASNFSFPIELPPGPGGFAPTLSLNYSSEAANNMGLYAWDNFAMQGGLAGLGWDLNVPGISAQGNWEEHKYFLSLPTGSYELHCSVPLIQWGVDGIKYCPSGTWVTEPNDFLLIKHYQDPTKNSQDPSYPIVGGDVLVQPGSTQVVAADANCTPYDLYVKDARPWYVWTKDGTMYQFGSYSGIGDLTGAYATGWVRSTSQGNRWLKYANFWGLVRAQDTNNNVYSVGWTVITKVPVTSNQPYPPDCNGRSQELFHCADAPNFYVNKSTNPWTIPEWEYTLEVLPTRIWYGEYGDASVAMVQLDFAPGRDDQPNDPYALAGQALQSYHGVALCSLPTPFDQASYHTYSLQQIVVWKGAHIVRKYALDIGHPAEFSTPHHLLKQIDIYGTGGTEASKYPASYKFTYWRYDYAPNTILLKAVENGLGGKVSFDYVKQTFSPWPSGCQWNEHFVVSRVQRFDGLGHITSSTYDYGPGHTEGNCSDSLNPELLLGHEYVTEKLYAVHTTPDPSGSPVRQIYTEFNVTHLLRGKATYQKTMNGSGVALQEQWWTWQDAAVLWPTHSEAKYWPVLTDMTTKVDGLTKQDIYKYWGDGDGKTFDGNLKYDIERGPDQNGNLADYRMTYTEFGAYRVDSPEPFDATVQKYLFRPLYKQIYREPNDICVQWTEYDYGNGYKHSPSARANLVGERTALAGCHTEPGAAYAEMRYAPDSRGNRLVEDAVVEYGSGTADPRTQYTYDPQGIYVVSKTEKTGGATDLVTNYYYDDYGRLRTAVAPNATATQNTYDAWGGVCLIQRGAYTNHTFYPDSPTSGTAYADSVTWRQAGVPTDCASAFADDQMAFAANMITFATKRYDSATPGGSDFLPGGVFSYEFQDGLGRTVMTQAERNYADDGLPSTTTYTEYNSLGQISVQTLPLATAFGGSIPNPNNNPKISYSYDALGRVVSKVEPATGTTTIAYGYASNSGDTDFQGGRRTAITTNARAAAVRLAYDAFGHLTSVSEFPNGWSGGVEYRTRYGYDVLDRLIQVQDAKGSLTTLAFNGAGWKTSMTDPDMGTWSYTYDLAGRLLQQKDALGQRTCNYYDRMNRVVGVQYLTIDCPATQPSSTHVTMSYDTCPHGAGQVCSQTTTYGTKHSIVETYDAHGRLSTETRTITDTTGAGTYKLQYTYNDLDLPVTVTYPNYAGNGGTGDVATTTYDATGQPYALKINGVSFVNSTTYTAWGAVSRQQFPNGRCTHNDYDVNLRLGRARTGANCTSDGGLMDIEYQYDAVSNVAAVRDWSSTGSAWVNYTYDGLNRLTGASGAWSASFSYDAVGNLTSKTENGVQVTLAYTNTAHVHAPGAVSGRGLGYDSNGNMTTRWNNGIKYVQEYDATNHLSKVTSLTNVVTFTYDAAGQRASVLVGASATTVHYVGGLYEKNRTSPQPVTEYFTLGPATVMRKWSSANTFTDTYLFSDHLHSASLATNTAGTSIGRQHYWPYGRQRDGWGSLTDKDFTGQRRDSTIELLDYGARRYDSYLGRFIQPDTIVPDPTNPQSLNRYSYALSNPVKFTDPTGHVQVCADGDEGGGCGYGSKESGVWQFFAESDRHPWFADAYASLYVADQAEFHGDSFAQDYRDGANAAMAQAVAFLPQQDWRADMAMAVDPGAVGKMGQSAAALVGGGASMVRQLSQLVSGKVGGAKPNQIGNNGVADVGKQLGVTMVQERVAGGKRVYDGYDPATGLYLEVKTTTRGRVSPTRSIRAQIAFDAGKPVIWTFVDGAPSSTLQGMLEAFGIPYITWYR